MLYECPVKVKMYPGVVNVFYEYRTCEYTFSDGVKVYLYNGSNHDITKYTKKYLSNVYRQYNRLHKNLMLYPNLSTNLVCHDFDHYYKLDLTTVVRVLGLFVDNKKLVVLLKKNHYSHYTTSNSIMIDMVVNGVLKPGVTYAITKAGFVVVDKQKRARRKSWMFYDVKQISKKRGAA
jgi:hypothetical protein